MSAPTPAPPPAAAAAAIASSNPVLSYAKSALHTLVRSGGAEAAASLQDAFRLAEGDPAAQACLLNNMALCAMPSRTRGRRGYWRWRAICCRASR